MIGFICFYRPYKQTSIFLSSLAGEIAALIAFSINLVLGLVNIDNLDKLEVTFVYSILGTMIFQTLIGLYELLVSFAAIYKKFDKKRSLKFAKSFGTSRFNSQL